MSGVVKWVSDPKPSIHFSGNAYFYLVGFFLARAGEGCLTSGPSGYHVTRSLRLLVPSDRTDLAAPYVAKVRGSGRVDKFYQAKGLSGDRGVGGGQEKVKNYR